MALQTPKAAADEAALRARLAALPLQPAVGELEPADDLHAESLAAAVRAAPTGKHWDALRNNLAEVLGESEVADVLEIVTAWLDEIPSARD